MVFTAVENVNCFSVEVLHPSVFPLEPPLADLVQFTAKTPPPASLSRSPEADSVMLLSPALWIFVVLATVGSIVALVLWFVIYKRQTRNISISGKGSEGLNDLFDLLKVHIKAYISQDA